MRRWSRVRRGRADLFHFLGAAVAIGALCATEALWLGGASSQRPTPHSQLPAPSSPNGMATVRRLCADEFAGRKAGTAGADRAAAWLAAELRRIGLEAPPGAPEYRQPFTLPVSLLASPWDRKAKLVGPGGRVAVIEYPCFYGDGFSAEAAAVFAGSGVCRRDQGWDDYQGRDVRGKYVVYQESAPGPGLDREEHARWQDARAHGALGCLVISRQPDAGNAGLESPIRDFPVLRLDPGTARQVLGSGAAESRRHSAAAAARQVSSARLSLNIPRAEDPARPAANLIGMLPGSDPAVAGEAIILSAHYDHLGTSEPEKESAATAAGKPAASRRPAAGRRPAAIFRGADDDASGVAVVLGVARALKAAGLRPRRTILFCLWSAEESGLIGSRAYVAHPLLPLDRTRFMLEVEMVGAGEPDRFLTSAARLAGPDYVDLQSTAAALGLTLVGDTCRGVSDHMAFLHAGVPATVITTAGEHPNYHTARDNPDRLKAAGIENATRLCAETIWRAANE